MFASFLLRDAKELLFLSKGELRVYLHQVCGRDGSCPVGPVSYVDIDVDIELGTGGRGVDDLWAGGLRGVLCGDADLGSNRIDV